MQDRTNDRVGVIGGGLGGLASACTLAARGHRVTLFEKNEWVGGKAAVLEQDGYRFDMGPTILTVPSVLRRIFAEADRRLEDHLDLVRLDPQWRCFFDDGSVLELHADEDRMAEAIGQLSPHPGDPDGYHRFLEFSRRLESISERFFFWRSVGSIRDTFDLKGTFSLSVLKDVLGMRPTSTVHGSIRSFIRDGRVAQLLDHFTQYVGSSPLNSPAVLCGIAHMQTGEGVWYPRGGIGAVPRALAGLAAELGVEVRTRTDVRRVLHDGQKVRGLVTTDGETVELGAIISNSDSVRTHRELIGGRVGRRFERRRRYEPACSGVVLYLGLDRAYDHIAHHNFVFSRDPEKEFREIYRRGVPASDPTCYVCAPARSEPGVAPEGGEALYVLVHTPYLRPGHDWKRMLPAYREVILEKLETTGGMHDLRDRIATESTLTPLDIHERYRVLDGAIYGLASHGRLGGAFKPANRSRDLSGLYLAGGSAHPGPGMPMALMSGWIAADSLHQDGVVSTPGKASETCSPVA